MATKKTKPSKRKFYKSLFTVEVLSEEPLPADVDLETVNYQCDQGDWSGDFRRAKLNVQVDGPTMAKLLQAQGSDPGFFQLTEKGEDTYDVDE